MNWFIEAFKSIPDVVWSGIIASMLTLSGVFLSNRSNNFRLRMQLEHDALEKFKERNGKLRQEIYIRVVQELTKANSYAASLPQVDILKENVASGFQGFFSAAASLQLVADSKTAILANELVGAYSEILLKIIIRLSPLQDAKAKIELNDKYCVRALNETQRVLDEMNKINEAAKNDRLIFEALQRSFDFSQGEAERYAIGRNAAWVEFNSENAKFSLQLFADMLVITKQQIPLLVEIRRDLGLATDVEILKQMEDQVNRMSLNFKEAMQKLQESLVND